ncbi:MAG: hypothetical protein WCO09_03465 [bacterium]
MTSKISIHFWIFITAILLGMVNLGFLVYLLRVYKQPASIVLNCDQNTLDRASETFKRELTAQNDILMQSKKKPAKKAKKSPTKTSTKTSSKSSANTLSKTLSP